MWAFWVLFVVAAVVLVLVMVRIERRRLDVHVRACQAAAARLGAAYAYDAPEALLPKLQGFDFEKNPAPS